MNAVDGDPRTAWRTGDFSATIGERLALTLDEPITTGSITLLAPINRGVSRWFTEVRLRFDGDDYVDASLDDRFRSQPGQRVQFGNRTFTTLEIEVLDDTVGRQKGYGGSRSTGFAEVTIGDRVGEEVLRVPDVAGFVSDVVLSRQRSAPTEALRDDEEIAIARVFSLAREQQFTVSGTARLSPRVADDALDRLVGVGGGYTVTSSARLPGHALRASAALDGDPATAWSTPFGPQEGQWIDVVAPAPVTFDRLSMDVVDDGKHSVPDHVTVEVDGKPAAGASAPDFVLDRPVTATHFRVVVDEVRTIETIDWYTRDAEVMPIAIAELGIEGVRVPKPPATFTTGCQSYLLSVDGHAAAIEVRGTTQDAIAGEPLTIRGCDPVTAAAGDVEVRSTPGLDTGVDIDRLVLSSSGRTERTPPAPDVTVTARDDDRVALTIEPADEPVWLSFGQSYNAGWRATVDGDDLGAPTLVDGYANGWLIAAHDEPVAVTLRFAPQHRVDVALIVSGFAALLCLALALKPAPHPRSVGDFEPSWPVFTHRTDGATGPAARRAVVRVVVLGLAGTLLAAPVVGLVVAIVAAVGMWRPSARRWLAVAPALAMLAAGAYVIAWQIRFRVPPGFDWPTHFERAHMLGWAAVLLLVTDLVVHRSARE